MQQLPELREKYTYNIRPFSSTTSANKRAGNMLPSDEDDLDEEDLEAINCFTGIIPATGGTNRGRGNKNSQGFLIGYSSVIFPYVKIQS